MKHVRSLMESRPLLVRKPDQSFLASKVESGGRNTRLQATRARDGSYAFVYSTNGRTFSVKMDKLSGSQAKAWWYDPRTGKATPIGTFPTSGKKSFDPPGHPGDDNDWVLVLDDTSMNFAAPGYGPSRDSGGDDNDNGSGSLPSQPGYLMAHRGGAGEAPENTLLAFSKALSLGATIEMDVYLTKDKHIVAIHDDTVDRTTNGSGKVNKMTLAEIKKLDAGQGEKIPTIDDIFYLFSQQAPSGTAMVLDIHGENSIMYDTLIRALKKYNLFDRTFVEVSGPQQAKAMRARPNGGRQVHFAMWVSNRVSEFNKALNADIIERIHARPQLIEKADQVRKHRPPKKLILGTVNKIDIQKNTERWKLVKDALNKIDGINTNDPEYIFSHIKNTK